MGNYYCLMAGLPDITLENTKQEVSMPDLREELEAVLSEKDKVGPNLTDSDNQFVYGKNC